MRIFVPNFLLFFLILISASKAMNQDDLDELHHTPSMKRKATPFDTKTVSRRESLPINFINLSEDMLNEIVNYLTSKEVLLLRVTSQQLKKRMDEDFWANRPLIIKSKSSAPAVQEIQDLPCHTVSLFFEKWEKKDLEPLLSFKYVTHLHLKGLQSWDFSINDLFNFSASYLCSYLNSLIGIEKPLYSNVTFLDLSGSRIGDYGVTSFVSQFKKLKTLNLSKNDIGDGTAGVAKALGNLTTLISLDISYNEFSDVTLQELTQLKNLTSLDVSYNCISNGGIIKKLHQDLPQLTHLNSKGQKQKYNYSKYAHSNSIPTSGIVPLPLTKWSIFNYGLPYGGR